MKVWFVSTNSYKIQEVKQILSEYNITVVGIEHKIDEIQTIDVSALIRDKAIKAFKYIGRPVFVEHTSLHTEGLSGFPGGLTQIFWDTLESEKFANLFKNLGNQKAVAKTHIAYVDAKKIHMFEGEIAGSFSDIPRGPKGFQWDCVFIPEGKNRTFAEMGSEEKNRISMRKLALDEFVQGIKGDV